MKRSNIKCIGLLVLSAFAMGAMGGCSSTGSRVDSAIVRDATSKVEQKGMFSSICKTDDNGVSPLKPLSPSPEKTLRAMKRSPMSRKRNIRWSMTFPPLARMARSL